MKLKFPSYATLKFYLHLVTLKFPGNTSFIKNPELRNSGILFA